MTMKILLVLVLVIGAGTVVSYVVVSGQSKQEEKEAVREEAGRHLRSSTFDLKPGQSW